MNHAPATSEAGATNIPPPPIKRHPTPTQQQRGQLLGVARGDRTDPRKRPPLHPRRDGKHCEREHVRQRHARPKHKGNRHNQHGVGHTLLEIELGAGVGIVERVLGGVGGEMENVAALGVL